MAGELDDFAAVEAILNRLKKTMKPGGVMVIAIENSLGLKYWYGAGEDHAAIPYVGLYGYPDKRGVRTYSKRQLQELLQRCGWSQSTFLYPFPDYKLPRVVLHESFVDEDPYAHSLLSRIQSQDYLTAWQPVADEFLTWKGLHQSQYLGDYANSFLILASDSEETLEQVGASDFVHFSDVSRKICFRTKTVKKRSEPYVEKIRFDDQKIPDGPVGQVVEKKRYIAGELLSTIWQESFFRQDGEQIFIGLVNDYYKFLKKSEETNEGLHDCVDLLPSNIIVDKNKISHVIDQEWHVGQPITVDFILFRALLWFANHNRSVIRGLCERHALVTIDDFINFCFNNIKRDYQQLRVDLIRLEELIQDNIAYFAGKALDVETFLSQQLIEPGGNTADNIADRPRTLLEIIWQESKIMVLLKRIVKKIIRYQS